MKATRLSIVVISALLLLGGCSTSEQDRQKAILHTRLGLQYLQQGDSTSALRELMTAQKYNPEDAGVHYALGWAYSAKSLFPQALESYREALRLDPKYTDARNAIGAIHLETGQWDAAIAEFEPVLKDLLYPTPYYVINNIGWAYYKKGDLRRAIESFQKAVSLKPDFGLAFYNLGLAYRDNKQPGEAIKAFRNTLVLVPNLADAHLQLGVLLFNEQQPAEAQKSFQEVIRLAPGSENARLAQQYLDFLKKSGK
jgi:type IV pilus biogenesis/stability protein PilW